MPVFVAPCRTWWKVVDPSLPWMKHSRKFQEAEPRRQKKMQGLPERKRCCSQWPCHIIQHRKPVLPSCLKFHASCASKTATEFQLRKIDSIRDLSIFEQKDCRDSTIPRIWERSCGEVCFSAICRLDYATHVTDIGTEAAAKVVMRGMAVRGV